MNKIKRIVSFFLKMQGVNNENVTFKEEGNTLHVICNASLEIITELYSFLVQDYNPNNHFALQIKKNGCSLEIIKK